MARVEWFTKEQQGGPHQILSRYDRPIVRYGAFGGYDIIGYVRRDGPDDTEAVDITPPEWV